MNTPQDNRGGSGGGFRWLEQLTGMVLGLVALALCWMLAVSYQPGVLRLASETTEVVVVITLLSVALGLVSLVALIHTRSRK